MRAPAADPLQPLPKADEGRGVLAGWRRADGLACAHLVRVGRSPYSNRIACGIRAQIYFIVVRRDTFAMAGDGDLDDDGFLMLPDGARCV